MKNGTEQQYSHLAFSPNEGSLLASVGGYPDYLLTVWDWKLENIVLRSKAFSQDIYKVSFSPELPGQLTTSGTGHIRFWKMAKTFTGLKLQGYLGKFGKTELTDISGKILLYRFYFAMLVCCGKLVSKYNYEVPYYITHVHTV